MRICTMAEMSKLAPLFDGWEETMIYSCLQGIMGKVYAAPKNTAAAAVIGDFCFFAGEPDEEAVRYDYGIKSMIAVPKTEAWSQVIERVYGKSAVRWTRYATEKDPSAFDREALVKIVEGLPEGFVLSPIDGDLYDECLKCDWSRDFVVNFKTKQDYERQGVGAVALYDERVVAGASSHTVYNGGIEIEIATEKDFRRRGLAAVCGASLILMCLERGLYPSWDAHTKVSLALAEKLGYRFSHEYPVYLIDKSNNSK